nr:phosphotransferase [Shewanella sp. 1CM18E]
MITRLSQGLSNQNYCVRGCHPSYDGESFWVLRVNSWASSQICDRRAEVANWRLAASHSLAPEVVYVSPCNRFYLSRYYSQQQQYNWSALSSENGVSSMTTALTNSLNESSPPHSYKSKHSYKSQRSYKAQQLCQTPSLKLANTLGKSTSTAIEEAGLILPLLNGLAKLPEPENKMSVDKQWHVYHHRLQSMFAKVTALQARHCNAAQTVLLTAWKLSYAKLVANIEQTEAMLRRLNHCMIRQQFSHRDLNPFNILLVEGALKCIDFEYACSSHPLCDLAAVLASHSLSNEQRQWIIEEYLASNPNLNHHAGSAVSAAIDLYWVFAVCWALQMAFDHLIKEGEVEVKTADKDLQAVEGYLACAEQYYQLISKP